MFLFCCMSVFVSLRILRANVNGSQIPCMSQHNQPIKVILILKPHNGNQPPGCHHLETVLLNDITRRPVDKYALFFHLILFFNIIIYHTGGSEDTSQSAPSALARLFVDNEPIYQFFKRKDRPDPLHLPDRKGSRNFRGRDTAKKGTPCIVRTALGVVQQLGART